MMIEFITNDDIPTLKKTATKLRLAEETFKKEIESYKSKAEEIKAQVEQAKMKHEMELENIKQAGQTQRQNSINETQLIINNVLNTIKAEDTSTIQKDISNRSIQQQKLEQNERKMQSSERIASMNKN